MVGKRAEIANTLDSTKPDIITGTETWLDSSIGDAEFFPSHYTLYRKDRNRGGCGVLNAVRDDIQGEVVDELDTDCEILWVKLLTRSQKHVYICAFYRPNVSDALSMQRLESSLRRAAGMRNAELLVAGDFNLPRWDCTNMTTWPPTQHSTRTLWT